MITEEKLHVFGFQGSNSVIEELGPRATNAHSIPLFQNSQVNISLSMS